MAWAAVAVGVAGLAIKAGSAISQKNIANKSLNANMTAAELKAAYERDLLTTQNFEQWAAQQTAAYQTFNQTTATKNTFIYAASTVVVLVAGISLIYILKEE